MKFNNKGFTLIEMLAVVVILGIISTIMIPSVNYIISKNKEDNLNNLNKSIVSAVKLFVSDNRYNISLSGKCNDDNTGSRDINKIGDIVINDNMVNVSTLVSSSYLSVNKGGIILNPNDDDLKLDMDNSYIIVRYDCKNRDYLFDTPKLEWIKK